MAEHTEHPDIFCTELPRMAVTNGNHVGEAVNGVHGQPLDLTVLGMNSGTSMVDWTPLTRHWIKG